MPTEAVTTPVASVVTDLRSFLLGSFELCRVIVAAGESIYRFSGEATFSKSQGDELVYHEHGELASEHDSFEVSRTYRYDVTGRTVATVRFADGSLFYDLDLSRGRCRVSHVCGDDAYHGLIVVRGQDLLTRWSCVGPSKDYVATSRLVRHSPLRQVEQ